MRLSIRSEQLAQMHSSLVHEAKNAITATESSVEWLRKERQQHEHRVMELQAATAQVGQGLAKEGATGRSSKCGCCRTSCVIL